MSTDGQFLVANSAASERGVSSPTEVVRQRQLDLIVQPQTTSATSVALDRHYLERVAMPDFEAAGILRIYAIDGDALSLGHYHLAPDLRPLTPVTLHRRLSGGRVVAFGEGFIGVSLILPHRGALLGQPPESLQAYQVLNRYVRGLLDGFKMINLPAIYPGLDSITVRRLPFAMISIEESARGAVLFEAVIANSRDFSVLPQFLDAVDPDGVLKAAMIDASSVTSLKSELQGELPMEEVAVTVQRGYEKQFGIACHSIDAAAPAGTARPTTLRRGSDVTALDRHAIEHTQLGMFEAYASVGTDRRIRDIQFVGDFIANSTAIETLQTRLRGVASDAAAIDRIVLDVFGTAPNFILGIGQPSTITQVICRALQ